MLGLAIPVRFYSKTLSNRRVLFRKEKYSYTRLIAFSSFLSFIDGSNMESDFKEVI